MNTPPRIAPGTRVQITGKSGRVFVATVRGFGTKNYEVILEATGEIARFPPECVQVLPTTKGVPAVAGGKAPRHERRWVPWTVAGVGAAGCTTLLIGAGIAVVAVVVVGLFLFIGVAGSATSGSASVTSVVSPRPDVTERDVADAIVGSKVGTWTFEAAELRQPLVLSQEKTNEQDRVHVSMKTRDADNKDECSGELLLRFEWKERWLLKSIEASGVTPFSCKRTEQWQQHEREREEAREAKEDAERKAKEVEAAASARQTQQDPADGLLAKSRALDRLRDRMKDEAQKAMLRKRGDWHVVTRVERDDETTEDQSLTSVTLVSTYTIDYEHRVLIDTYRKQGEVKVRGRIRQQENGNDWSDTIVDSTVLGWRDLN